MDLSALESVSRALEESLDFWGLLVSLSTAVVVVGLLIEYWDEAHQFWTMLRWPAAAFPWHKAKVLFGGLFVTLGVAGELGFTYKASRTETDLRNNSHRIETLLRQQSGDAKDSAKKAQDSADAVGRQYGDLLEKYEAAEKEIIELKAAKLPRRLSSDQKDLFRAAVNSFTVKTFDIACVSLGGGSKEILDFELDFVDAINNKSPVKFQYLLSCATFVGGAVTFVPPIQVEIGADRAQDGAVLIKALEQIGIKRKEIETKPNSNRSLLGLTLGPKTP